MRSLPPQLSFADLELQFQGVQLDPILRAISEFLDQHLTLIEQVRKDLERGLKNPRTGRNGIAPRRCSARWFSCASRTGIIANCKSASTMASPYAALPSLTASPSPSRMPSTALSTGLHRRRFATLINSWSRRLSNWGWKTERLSASTPR